MMNSMRTALLLVSCLATAVPAFAQGLTGGTVNPPAAGAPADRAAAREIGRAHV